MNHSSYYVFSTLILFIIILVFIELSHKLRPKSPIKVKPFNWNVIKDTNRIKITGWFEIRNPKSNIEIMIPEFKINPILLGKEGVNNICKKVNIRTFHEEGDNREDEYWNAYIVKSNKSTNVFITIDLISQDDKSTIQNLENIWIDTSWISYGPFGMISEKSGHVVSIKEIESSKQSLPTLLNNRIEVIPIKTHMLGSLDNIGDVMEKYTNGITREGDILTIGETPLAIMQGRYISPSTIKTTLISRSLCKAFHPTSSLATACGLQSLINIVGPSRVLISWIIAVLGKFIGIKGLFYRLAGEQARLIDDITGTTPPYDKCIVMGPKYAMQICKDLSNRLKVDVAIVDVNDLGKVKVLATSDITKDDLLKSALTINPAGNADQQTPIVLVRQVRK